MPRKKIKPTLHNQKYDRYIKVKYERIGKRKIFEMQIPVTSDEVGVNSQLEPLIARQLDCNASDIFLIDKNTFEPYMVMNPREEDEQV